MSEFKTTNYIVLRNKEFKENQYKYTQNKRYYEENLLYKHVEDILNIYAQISLIKATASFFKTDNMKIKFRNESKQIHVKYMHYKPMYLDMCKIKRRKHNYFRFKVFCYV